MPEQHSKRGFKTQHTGCKKMIKLENHFKKIKSQMAKLPEKLNFKIGEVALFAGTPSHVLRYWEKEFPVLNPEKFTNKQRLYSKKDIKTLLLIKALLYEEKFSIEGLRKHLPSYCRQLKNYKEEFKTNPAPVKKKVQKLLHSISQMRTTIEQLHQ